MMRGVFAPQRRRSGQLLVYGGPSADCSWIMDLVAEGVEGWSHPWMSLSPWPDRLGFFSDSVRKCPLGMEAGCVAQDKTEQETADRWSPADSAMGSHMYVCCRETTLPDVHTQTQTQTRPIGLPSCFANN